MSHEYNSSFLELDLLLKHPDNREREFQSCFALNYAELNKMCQGNYTTAIVLSRILYWWRPAENGDSKFSARLPEGKSALAKSAYELAIETGMSEASAKRALKNLAELGLITIAAVKRFNGHQTRHILLNEQLFVELFWNYYIQIQLELAEHRLSLCSKDKVEQVAYYENRIEQLNSPNFDPRTDFPTFVPEAASTEFEIAKAEAAATIPVEQSKEEESDVSSSLFAKIAAEAKAKAAKKQKVQSVSDNVIPLDTAKRFVSGNVSGVIDNNGTVIKKKNAPNRCDPVQDIHN